jgi:hypothetical protein
MVLRIYKWVGSQPIWLKPLAPSIKWGPHAQARIFKDKGEATSALRLIPGKDQPIIVGEGAPQSDPTRVQSNPEPG